MIALSFGVLSAGVLLGLVLLARLVGALIPGGRVLAYVHGGAGGSGLLLALLALGTGRIGGTLAWVAAGVIASALALGLAYALGRGGRGVVLIAHALLGWLGYLLLAAFVAG